jgi:hypothetical protein
MRPPGRLPLSALCVLGAAVWSAASAGPAAAAGPVFKDRVLTGPVAHIAQATPPKKYLTADGTAVEARVSSSVANPDGVAQGIVNFLGSRVHGAELGKLRVFIGTPDEISRACGGDADVLACYSAGERRMYIPDRDPGAGSSAGFTRNYAITHEYGHHLAAYRSNSPFAAINYGAKYWSSYEFICSGTDAGVFFPGNQGSHYLDDPGEGFADTYAHLPENGFGAVRWQFNSRLRPDAGAFAAIRRDVLSPWRGSARKVVSGSLNSVRRVRFTSFPISLDGTVDLKLRGPARANFNVAILDGSRLISRTTTAGSRDHLRLTACRERTQRETARVRISRVKGAGAYSLTMLYPG